MNNRMTVESVDALNWFNDSTIQPTMNDLKFAFRQLLKNPGFTAVAVLTLALGIGANTAAFSWIQTVLLRSVPGVAESDRLVVIAPRHLSGNLIDTEIIWKDCWKLLIRASLSRFGLRSDTGHVAPL